MKPREIRSVVRFRPTKLSRVERLLQRCVTVEDWQREAWRRWPRSIRGYVDGGAEAEVAVARNRAAYQSRKLVPASLRDVSVVDTRTTLLGQELPLPIALAPTGYTRMMHPEGEVAVARAAADAGVPYALSTVANTSIEDLAARVGGERWFQLYVWRDRRLTHGLLDRAQASGYRTLMLTVDTPVTGLRVRDAHSGFTIPPRLTARTVADMATRPGWWTGMLRGEPIEFANFPPEISGGSRSAMALSAAQFDPAVGWSDLEELRARWHGPFVVKGMLRAEDVARAAAMGVDAVVLSNHGGRQLDRAVTPLDVLPDVRRAAGTVPLLVDSGIRSGADIAIAIATGADAVLVGRPYLYGLGAAGEQGVAAVLRLLREELERTMALLGVTSVEQLRKEGPELVLR